MKIAGYLLTHRYDPEYFYDSRLDPTTYGPDAYHKQCAWNYELFCEEHLIALVKIPIEEADKYTCGICEQKLSTPAYFAFESDTTHR